MSITFKATKVHRSALCHMATLSAKENLAIDSNAALCGICGIEQFESMPVTKC